MRYDWKQQIGADYNATDILTDVTLSAVTGGVMAGGGKALSKGAAKLFGKSDVTVGEALEVFEKASKAQPEYDVVVNTLKNSDPNEPLGKVLKQAEQIDRDANKIGPRKTSDIDVDLVSNKPDEYHAMQERILEERIGPMSEPKVTHVTPSDGKSVVPELDMTKLSEYEREAVMAKRSLDAFEECW